MRQPATTLLLFAQAVHTSLGSEPTNLPSNRKDTVNHTNTNSTLEFIHNSGICETTPGVDQYSGYLSMGKDGGMNIWFWLFEARRNPETAPLVAWFNGGPGCSSMAGLFQENGPCMFPTTDNRTDSSADDEPISNPYSYNNHANVIYIDQPVGTGFSYSDDDGSEGSEGSESAQVNSTTSATVYVWELLQAFYGLFPGFRGREVGIFTESYGGHYGPAFVSYIQYQNRRIQDGAVTGHIIHLTTLGINNGWFDASIQQRAYIEYAYGNPYRQLITSSQRATLRTAYEDHCRPAITNCTETRDDAACRRAEDVCLHAVQYPITQAADFNAYDLRQPADDPSPGDRYARYLERADVVRRIGARTEYTDCSGDVYERFERTGDHTRSTLATLATLLDTGINILLWAGDADWICNWAGSEAVANAAIASRHGNSTGNDTFREQKFEPYTVRGVEKGLFKRDGNLTLMRVFEAGHEVGFYQPEISLQVFEQMLKGDVYST